MTLDRVFSPQDMDRIRRGVVPEAMEDKWFIYWKEGMLFFQRSWTGFCIYVVRFAADHRTDPGADPAARRQRHCRHARGPQGRRHPTRHPGCRGHPIARTSIPSSSASRSARPSFAPLAVAAPRRAGRSSASAWRTAALTNAVTMFGTAGTRPPHGHEKRFS